MKESLEIKIKRVLKEGLTDTVYFSPCIGYHKIQMILFPDSLRLCISRNEAILNYLEKTYFDLINTYKHKSSNAYDVTDNSPLWFFWWQGEDSMPEIIRMCYQNRTRMAGKHPVFFITKDNIKEYVRFPDYVWKQFEGGTLRIQHLADMARVQLIRNFGGIWLDASVYCVQEIPECAFQKEIFSLRNIPDKRFVSECRWTTFAIGGRKGSLLFAFLDDFFIAYCKTGKPFIDYYMFDCAIAVAYNNIPQIKAEIDRLVMQSQSLYWLNDHLSANKNVYLKELDSLSMYQKISWGKWNTKTIEKGSVFQYLLEREYTYEQGEHHHPGV